MHMAFICIQFHVVANQLYVYLNYLPPPLSHARTTIAFLFGVGDGGM